MLSHKVKIIGAKKPANYFYLRYSPVVGESCHFICMDRHAIDIVCSHTVYIPMQIHYMMPLLQYWMSLILLMDQIHHLKVSVHSSCCSLTSTCINMHQRISYAN